MSGRRSPFLVAVLVALPLALASCDNDHGRGRLVSLTAPSTAPFGGPANAAVGPQFLSLRHIAGFNCPFVAPFTTDFDLVVNGPSGTDLFLNRVGFEFSDAAGLRGSPLLVSATDLAAKFGDTRIRAGRSRSFRFQPQFGCGLARPIVVNAQVVLGDLRGLAQQVSLQVPIR